MSRGVGLCALLSYKSYYVVTSHRIHLVFGINILNQLSFTVKALISGNKKTFGKILAKIGTYWT